MAKRKDPAVGVLRYFETADIGQARLILALAKDTVARRSGPEQRGPRAAATMPAGDATPIGVRRRRAAPTESVPQAAAGLIPPPAGRSTLPGA